MTTNLDPERRARLLAGKLRALVAAHTGVDAFADDVPGFPGGTAVVAGGAAWVLIESETAGLGGVLAWVDQQRAAGTTVAPVVNVVLDDGERAPGFARQGSHFTDAPRVWSVDGRDLVAVVPGPIPASPPPPAAALALTDELAGAGLDVVVEHGKVSGEVEGLEVAVVLVDDDGNARIEVGVGRNDREAFGLLHGDLPTADAIAKVAATVREHRRQGANPHPLNRMASERWLRSHLLRDDQRLAGWDVDPVAGPVARTSVSDKGPAYAIGTDDQGTRVVVACSIGIDLELVPAAADARAWLDPGAELVLAVPARDAHPVTERLAARLVAPARVLPIEGEWRR